MLTRIFCVTWWNISLVTGIRCLIFKCKEFVSNKPKQSAVKNDDNDVVKQFREGWEEICNKLINAS